MKAQRKHSSNIGVRRQHSAPRPVASLLPHTETNTNNISGRNRAALAFDTTTSSTETGDKRLKSSVGSRLEHLKRDQLVRLRYYLSSGNEDEDKENDKSFATGGIKQASSRDSDVDSPLTILVNPDLDILPVAKTEQARGAFDFYLNSYVTSIIEVSPGNRAPYSQIVHQILHDELLFTAFTTCSEAARWRTQTLYDDPPLSVAKGYGKTISLLSQRLQSDKFAMSSTVLLTMGQLVAIETMIKNVSATARHLAGMQKAMQPKGDATRFRESSQVQTAVDVWTQYFIHRATIRPTIPKTEALSYPKLPFDQKLAMQISELPPGFSELALSGRLSIQMLTLMERFNGYFTRLVQWDKDGVSSSPERTQTILLQAAYCIEYQQIQVLGMIERLVLSALTAYVVRRDRVHPALVNIRNYFQITCAYLDNLLSANEAILQQQDHGSDLFVWIGLLLLLTSSPEAYARKLALRLLRGRPEPQKILKKCEQFFWDDDLTNALLSGNILITNTSNDIIADNVRQALPESAG